MDFFIAGTDTGVGKTAVTAALLAGLRTCGTDAVAMKPVQTGAVRGRSPDLDFCAGTAGWKFSRKELGDLCPYRFPVPASPHLAARLAGDRISAQKILAAFRNLRSRHDAILVEGAGGVFVPLRDEFSQLDLIRRMGLPVIVVCRAGLGTLNHTLLTAEALLRRNIEVAAFVLSESSWRNSIIEKDNAQFLKTKLMPTPVCVFPRVRKGDFARRGIQLLDAITESSSL